MSLEENMKGVDLNNTVVHMGLDLAIRQDTSGEGEVRTSLSGRMDTLSWNLHEHGLDPQ